MKWRVSSSFVALLGALALLGCDGSQVTAGEQASWFRATVTGGVEASYEGRGFFDVWKNESEGGTTQFVVLSRTSDDSQNFTLYDINGGRPARGTYAIGLDGRFRVVYVTREANRVQYFVAHSGKVEITSSSKDRLEGTFHFQGFRYCAGQRVGNQPTEGPCSIPKAVIPDAPTIGVSGSFAAIQTTGEALAL
jgi:hypothetical protein